MGLGWLSAPPQRGGPCAQGWGGACPPRGSASATWDTLETTAAYVMRAMSGLPPAPCVHSLYSSPVSHLQVDVRLYMAARLVRRHSCMCGTILALGGLGHCDVEGSALLAQMCARVKRTPGCSWVFSGALGAAQCSSLQQQVGTLFVMVHITLRAACGEPGQSATAGMST